MRKTKNIPNKTTAQVLNQKISAGIDEYFTKKQSVIVNGKSYTPAALKAVLQAEDDATKAVDSTRAQLKEQVATHRAARASAQALRMGLRDCLSMNYGPTALQMFGDFGMEPKKSGGKKTAASKAKAVEKARATREAHDTTGNPVLNQGVQQPAAAVSPTQGAPAATPAPVAQVQPAQNTAPN
jgi:uncharacterized protein (DUF2267 family)